MLNNLSNAMYYMPHTFWSGGKIVQDSAFEYSMMNGATSLEMTRLGNYLERLGNFNEGAWRIASNNFANQVQNGSYIYSFQNATGVSIKGMWATVEYPVLISKAIEILYKIIGS